MPGGTVPEPILSLTAAATIFAVMFVLGLGIVAGEFRWVLRQPALLARALICVLIAVPMVAMLVMPIAQLPRPVEIGILLMAIAPGAPVALRRSLGAGGHRAFAPALQVSMALLAVVSMPLSIAILERVYGGSAGIAPGQIMRQVFLAQLLPLALGILVRRVAPAWATAQEPRLARLSKILLALLLLLVVVDSWRVLADARLALVITVVVITALSVLAGHVLGGPDPSTRTAVAISSAARNPGLALLVATVNNAAPLVFATIIVYLVVAALTLTPYLLWRRRRHPSLLAPRL